MKDLRDSSDPTMQRDSRVVFPDCDLLKPVKNNQMKSTDLQFETVQQSNMATPTPFPCSLGVSASVRVTVKRPVEEQSYTLRVDGNQKA